MNALETFVLGYLATKVLNKMPNENRSRLKLLEKIKSNWGDYILSKAEQFNVPAKYIYGIIATESSGNPDAIGSAGEIGLMQLTNLAYENVNHIFNTDFDEEKLKNPYNNILCGVMYLHILHVHLPDWHESIMAYNIGLGNVQRGHHLKSGEIYLNKVLKYAGLVENVLNPGGNYNS